MIILVIVLVLAIHQSHSPSQSPCELLPESLSLSEPPPESTSSGGLACSS